MQMLEAKKMARALMEEHELYDWLLGFDNAKRRAGSCHYGRKVISLSENFVRLNSADIVRNTLLHEIVHALAGPGSGHGKLWKATARAIGCTADRCYDSSQVIMPEPPFIGSCTSCGQTVERHRRKRIACGRCCKRFNAGRFTEKFLLKWRRA